LSRSFCRYRKTGGDLAIAARFVTDPQSIARSHNDSINHLFPDCPMP
jgi:hypothetical protein